VTNSTSQTASCQPGTGTGGTPTTSTSTTVVYCGHPGDCTTSGTICGANGTCVAGPCSTTNPCIFGYTCGTDGTCQGGTNACDKDSDCASGSLCIAGPTGGGTCTPTSDQCFDQSQCAAGENCVAGKCTLPCATNADCRDGYNCDLNHHVCTNPAQMCNVTNDCGSASLVCVGGACVPRSTAGNCTTPGDVWTENGCIPNQAAKFTCANDGVQDACNTGSICLHHDCWISCDPSTNSPCSTQTILNTCKAVIDNVAGDGGLAQQMTYNVCGTQMSLGNQCGPGSGNNMPCATGSVCIDGYCK
jgi:hypothetical protein